MRIVKDGQNQMLKDGVLSETARKAIAGMMELAEKVCIRRQEVELVILPRTM